MFPSAKVILLLRDPFDVLDSYCDMQKPGGWNQQYANAETPLAEESVHTCCEHIRTSMLAAQKIFDTFPLEQRLSLRYEELLEDPAACLRACGQLLSVDVAPETLLKVVDDHSFDKHKTTGTLHFRRQGKAGSWRESQNFTPEVMEIAEEVLGVVRARLGYQSASHDGER